VKSTDSRTPKRWAERTTGREDLERAVAVRLGEDRAHVSTVVRAFLSELAAELARGRRVEIRRFGRWKISDRAATAGKRNPRTGAPVRVGPRRSVRFKASSVLSGLVQQALDAERTT